MVKLNSIRTKLIIIVSGAFLVSTISIFLIADKQLTEIIDSSQNELYRQKVEGIWKILDLANQELEKTGLIEAYIDDFQRSTLKELRLNYYDQENLQIYPFINDTDGNIVMHPDLAEGFSSPAKRISATLAATTEGEFEDTYNRQQKYYKFKRFSPWNWVVGYTVPVEIKYADAHKFRNLLLLIMGGVILTITLIVSYLIYRFTSPIGSLTQAAHKMAEGQFDQQININSKDEIGILAQSFNRMGKAIQGTITDLKKENTERKKAEEELAREKELLTVTLRSIGDAVITTNIHGHIVLMNRMAEELTGWSATTAIGYPIADVLHIIDPETDERRDHIIDLIVNENERSQIYPQSFLVAQNGDKKTISSSIAAIMDDQQNQVVGVVTAFRDISEEIKLEQELQKNNKLESIGVLAGGIAHDFNNILVGILGNVNLVQMTEQLSDKAKKWLEEAEQASLKAKDLTQQLLTFSKGGDPVKEILSLEEIIPEASNFALHGQQVSTTFNCPEDLWKTRIDKNQIRQVIENIILNASQAMEDSGTIDIACHNLIGDETTSSFLASGHPYVCISIRDKGIGISSENIDKIFDPFFSTKALGSGMGLAICHSIIAKHNGQIKVDSTPGSGTTFHIYLPAIESRQERDTETAPTQEALSKAVTILLMDDEELVRTVAKEMLIRMGYQVLQAENGEQAVDIYRQKMTTAPPVDLVIMDLTIPGAMGGKEAIKQLLELDPKVKAIVSSGYSNDPIMADCQSYGFKDAIVKPFRYEEFYETIKNVLNQSNIPEL